MSTPRQPKAGLSPRDRKLLLGFGLFVEGVLLYMLLVDPALMRLDRAREQEAASRGMHARLVEALPKPRSETEPRLLPPASELAPGPLVGGQSSPTVAIQRILGERAGLAGVRILRVRVNPEPQLQGTILTHEVSVELTGAYEAVAAFLEDLEAPDPVRGIALFDLSTSEADADQVDARLTLRFFLRKP